MQVEKPVDIFSSAMFSIPDLIPRGGTQVPVVRLRSKKRHDANLLRIIARRRRRFQDEVEPEIASIHHRLPGPTP